jgi:hypothetical protein
MCTGDNGLKIWRQKISNSSFLQKNTVKGVSLPSAPIQNNIFQGCMSCFVNYLINLNINDSLLLNGSESDSKIILPNDRGSPTFGG